MPVMTTCGLPAPDPFAGSGYVPAACGSVGSWGTPLITVDDLATHPESSCEIPQGAEPLVEQLIVALSDMVRNHYGQDLGACLETRCFPLRRGMAEIDLLLRVDQVEVADQPCDDCAPEFEEVNLNDVVVGSPSGRLPWQDLRICDTSCSCGAGLVRVTGAWGSVWPLPSSVTGVLVVATHTLLDAVRKGRQVIATAEDGQTVIEAQELPFEAFEMLPESLFHYRGLAL